VLVAVLVCCTPLPLDRAGVKQSLTWGDLAGHDEAVVGWRRVSDGQASGLPALAGPRGRRGSGVKGGRRPSRSDA